MSMPWRLALAWQAGATKPGKLPGPGRPGPDEMRELVRVAVKHADAQAAHFGPALPSLLADASPLTSTDWALPGWTSIRRPGWTWGDPLALSCDHCERDLRWVDWWHADAVRLRNNSLVFCPDHGGSVTHHDGKRLAPLVRARQQLASCVYPSKENGPRYAVYAYELLGLGRRALYVGETTKTVDDRYAEHVAGTKAPRVVRGGAGTVGPLRQDLVGDLPALGQRAASLAAQHWVHLSLQHRGYKVYGDGKR